jgi:hypothetical protein
VPGAAAPQLGDACGARVLGSEPGQQFIEEKEQGGVLGQGAGVVKQFASDAATAPLEPPPRPRVLDEDPAHGLGGRGKEVTPIVEFLIAHQPQIGLVHQGRGVEGLAGLLPGELLRGELAQLVIDQR